MNRYITVFLAITVVSSTSFGAITDYENPGTTDPDVLSNTNYVGTTGSDAANISNISDLDVQNAGFLGGDAPSISSATPQTIKGASGLAVSNVDDVSILNQQTEAEKVVGGSGGSVQITVLGSTTGEAKGGNALSFGASSVPQTLGIQNGWFEGGSGGTVTGLSGNTLIAEGGAGIYADNGTIAINQALIYGGSGGVVSTPSASVSALGGHGLDVNFSVVDLATLGNNVDIYGGAGGVATSSGGTFADASGGSALNLRWNLGVITDVKPLVVTGGKYTGGMGGTATSADEAIADGGDALLLGGGQSVIISNGTFTGGAGGTATATDAQADGGAGARITFANVNIFGSGAAKAEILGGVFNGGAAGSVNGLDGETGYGLVLESSDTVISGTTEVNGRGLLVDSFGIPSTTLISDGTFSGATFTSQLNALYPSFAAAVNTFTITGGDFGFVRLEGTAGNNGIITGGTISELSLGGASINDLTIGGTANYEDLVFQDAAVNNIAISNGVVSSGLVTMLGGTANINLWNDANFKNTSVSNGVMNFNNQSFNLNNGYVLSLESQNARVNFNGGVNLNSGGTLDVGLAQVSASTLTANPGSMLMTELADVSGGVTNGLITGGDLTFNTGLDWMLYGDFTNSLSDITLAVATNSITPNGLSENDINLTSNPDWMQGITNVVVESAAGLDNLVAKYGYIALAEALGVDGEFAEAMDDLDGKLPADLLSDLVILGQEESKILFRENFVRTPEVANALVGLQGAISGQFRDRSRTFLRLQNFGTSSVGAPRGVYGPSDWWDNSMGWLHDRLPSFDARGSMREASDRAPVPNLPKDPANVGKPYISTKASKVNAYSDLKNKASDLVPVTAHEDIEVPTTYQVWGRGYVSELDQDGVDDHAGYDSTVVGGVIGADKRYEKALLGLGGGYARTTLNGNSGNDAEADAGHVSAYFAAHGEKLFIDANASATFSSVETESSPVFGYTGKYDAQTAGFYLGGGFAIPLFSERVLLTPEASMLATYYQRDSYDETSDIMPTKEWDEYDTWSYQSAVGATLSMIRKIESFNIEMEFQPELRVHWLHEFNEQLDDEEYMLAGGVNTISTTLQAREEDLIQVGAGVRFSKWNVSRTEFGLDLDGTLGDDYSAFLVSGKLIHRF